MPKRKLSPQDKQTIRAEIKQSLAKGAKTIDIVNKLSSEYKVVPETIRWYIKGVQENRPVRPPGRPKGSGKKAGRPGRPPAAGRRGPGRPPKAAGRRPARPARTEESLFFLGADTAQVVLRHGGKETRIASVVYGDESRLISAVRSALSVLSR